MHACIHVTLVFDWLCEVPLYVIFTMQVQPKPIELVPGYGVFLTQRQLDAALDSSKNSPTRLIRSLLSTFFAPDVLAVSSACGTRKHKALDGDIVQACIRKLKLL